MVVRLDCRTNIELYTHVVVSYTRNVVIIMHVVVSYTRNVVIIMHLVVSCTRNVVISYARGSKLYSRRNG